MPYGVTYFGERAFDHCSSLSQISIPESVEYIALWAFSGCKSLLSIMIPAKETGTIDFDGCTSLKEISVNGKNKTYSSANGLLLSSSGKILIKCPGGLTCAVIPEGVTKIDVGAFKFCGNLREVEIPSTLRAIGKDIFSSCPLVAVHVQEQSKTLSSMDGVLFNADRTQLVLFPREKTKERYEVPDGVSKIKEKAFAGTVSLKEVIFPGSIDDIGSFAFQHSSVKYIQFSPLLGSLKVGLSAFGGANVGFYDPGIERLLDKPNSPVYLGGPLEDLDPRYRNAAVTSFLYARKHGIKEIEQYRDSYLEHIRNNKETYSMHALKHEDLLRLMLEENLLNNQALTVILEDKTTERNPEIIAALLEYRNRVFGTEIQEKDDFPENDPEFKRQLKIANRHEQIKDQNGINGIAFVATGKLMQFGSFDEYTGAHDLSDLKSFIQERGGFLRSSVSSMTDYLICNDPNSQSTKSRKAKELGVPVITEEEFLEMAEEKE